MGLMFIAHRAERLMDTVPLRCMFGDPLWHWFSGILSCTDHLLATVSSGSLERNFILRDNVRLRYDHIRRNILFKGLDR